MKEFLLIIILLAALAAGYFRFAQPKDWNNFLDSIKAPVTGEIVETAPVAPSKPQTEYITPNTTTFVHSSHINDVPQPPQPFSSASTNTPPPTEQVFVPPNPVPAQPAWVWTTSDGKIYKNVIIEKIEADQVTIFHDQGSAVIQTYSLSSDIQRLLNFDPALAAQATANREKTKKDTPAAQ